MKVWLWVHVLLPGGLPSLEGRDSLFVLYVYMYIWCAGQYHRYNASYQFWWLADNFSWIATDHFKHFLISSSRSLKHYLSQERSIFIKFKWDIFYTPTKICLYIYCHRPRIRLLVRCSINNRLYLLYFLMDFVYIWVVCQYHLYDNKHQIWWRSDNYSQI